MVENIFYQIRDISACDRSGSIVCDQDRSDRIRWDQKEFECITWFDKRILIYFVTNRDRSRTTQETRIQLQGRFDSKSWLKMISARSWIDLNDFCEIWIMKIPSKPHPHNFSHDTPTQLSFTNFLNCIKFSIQLEKGQFWFKNSNIWSKIEYFWVFLKYFGFFEDFWRVYLNNKIFWIQLSPTELDFYLFFLPPAEIINTLLIPLGTHLELLQIF